MTCALSVFFFYDVCHFSDFGSFLEGRLPPEDGSDRAENLTRSVSDEIAKNIFLARKQNLGVTFRIFPIFRIPRAHGSGALGSQPVRSTAILVDNKKNQIASRFDLFAGVFFDSHRECYSLFGFFHLFGMSFTPRG